jgi:hypothetical protein
MPDHVRRQFTAPSSDRLYQAEVTYVPTCSGIHYLVGVSNRPVDYGRPGCADLVISARLEQGEDNLEQIRETCTHLGR